MKASDYIVEYLINQKITDVFGYPGGMVIHLMDSLRKYQNQIRAHAMYHEQGAAMAACGYAQSSGKPGVVYATSGPGATNLITGICNAYMDSIPTVFITGQVNSFEQKGSLKVRQRGFQETDIVSMVSGITKFAVQVNSVKQLRFNLDKAFYLAQEKRKGPVLLDIAMDVMRTEIEPEKMEGFVTPVIRDSILRKRDLSVIHNLVSESECPVLILGNGLSRINKNWMKKVNDLNIPVVSSMISVDIKGGLKHYYGFIGAYGDRAANFIVAKSDLVITVGARLDVRQVGAKRVNFAPKANVVRIDIDQEELRYKVHQDEYDICADANMAIHTITDIFSYEKKEYSAWLENCNTIQKELYRIDDRNSNELMREISKMVPEKSVITTDVGQNQVWVAQSFEVRPGQQILFSGGHGAMGYSLPAAIGAYWATHEPVYSFNGDGGLQMNIQELQTIAREHIPVKVILFNNNALGMIRHFQEMYFDGNYFQTVPSEGFSSPNFEKIAQAYGLEYHRIDTINDILDLMDILRDRNPALIEIVMSEETYVFPKLEYGKKNQDQEPLLDRKLYHKLMKLGDNQMTKK